MMLSRKFDDALAFASGLHRAQKRKGTDIPYIAHCLAVSSLVLEHGGDEDAAIAGLLHDAVEDQGGDEILREIRKRFGDAVADIVADCTDAWAIPKPPWRERKEAYLRDLPSKGPASLLVSLADKVHNAAAIAHDFSIHGDDLWGRFNGGREGTIWYYENLRDIFGVCCPGPLQQRLARDVAAFSTVHRQGAPKEAGRTSR